MTAKQLSFLKRLWDTKQSPEQRDDGETPGVGDYFYVERIVRRRCGEPSVQEASKLIAFMLTLPDRAEGDERRLTSVHS